MIVALWECLRCTTNQHTSIWLEQKPITDHDCWPQTLPEVHMYRFHTIRYWSDSVEDWMKRRRQTHWQLWLRSFRSLKVEPSQLRLPGFVFSNINSARIFTDIQILSKLTGFMTIDEIWQCTLYIFQNKNNTIESKVLYIYHHYYLYRELHFFCIYIYFWIYLLNCICN